MGNRRGFPFFIILGLLGLAIISASPSTGRTTDFDSLRKLQVDENEADNEEVDVETPSERSNIREPYGFEEEDAIRRSQSKTEPFSFKSCAVAADHYTCSTAGKNMFKKGGSAVDAAIAAQFCIEVVNPHSTGIGGGGFMLIYEKKTGRTSSIDFRESLPLEYTDSDSENQGKTILTPGVLKGLQLAHKKYGKLKWNVLFEPAIDLCERGFKIHAALANAIKKKKAFIMAPKNEGLRELFAPNGKILKAGDVLKRPKLAQTFKRLAAGSADLFYKGDMAQEVVKDIREAGGVLSLTDLSGYRAIERGPLRTKLKDLEMLSTPPPGSGALISLALKILEDCKMDKEDIDNVDKLPETYHKIIEAMKFAYAPFTFLGDPRFTKYTDEVIKYMLDDKVAKNMFKRIDKVSHTVEYYGPYSSEKKPQQQGTSHISVLDPNGNAVSLTTTINAYFGSKLRSKRLGIIYNNELADFSEFWPSVYNLTKDVKIPGKRPMSKSSPIIFLDKKKNVKGIFGAAGGFFIPSCLTMTIANWLFFNDNIKMAVSRPRLHCQLFPPTVVYEPHLQAQVVPKLQSYSHAYVTNSTYDVSGQMNAILGVVQAIVLTDDGKIAAECDVRKGGLPDGY